MLTDLRCRSAKPTDRPQKLFDALGLFLHISPTGHKSWRLKYRVGPVEKLLTIGPYPEVTLTEARDRRDEARRQLRDGVDPGTQRRQRKAEIAIAAGTTVKSYITDWHATRAPGWRPHYAKAVLGRLELDVIPRLGKVALADVTAPMVLEVLQRVEKRGAKDVARRLRQHLDDIFATAMVSGAIKANPATGLQRALRPISRERRPAVRSFEEARVVLAAIEAQNAEPGTRLASRLLALTAVRPAMVRFAEPVEFEDLDGPAPLWRIPAAKMKLTAERRRDLAFEFVVPLSPAAVDVVKTAQAFATKDLMFPAPRARRKPVSDSTLSSAYRAAGFTGVHVPHGWRATFSTVMNEIAAIENRVGDRDIIDLMLAHIPNDVESTYNRYAYLPRRREIALEWAELLMKGAAPAASLLEPRLIGSKAVRHDRGVDGAPGARHRPRTGQQLERPRRARARS
ncbi:MAG: integrase arm-type DNA-binding domain-containing protein [Pseudomonadota bacterium]